MITCFFCFEQFEVSLEISTSFTGNNIEIYDQMAKMKIDNYKFVLEDLELQQHKNYKSIIGKLQVSNMVSKEERTLKPEIRIYDSPQTLTYEASIQSNFFRDYYLTMSNIDRSNYYNIKFQKKPLMIWIWISVIFLSLGGILSLSRNAKNN